MHARGKDFEEECRFNCSFYKDDFQLVVLLAQLLSLGVDFENAYKEARGTQHSTNEITIFDVRNYFQSLPILVSKTFFIKLVEFYY